jgi:ribosome modulation factor
MKRFKNLAAAGFLALCVMAPAASHAQYGPPQGPPPPGWDAHGPWEGPPSEYSDIQRRGFHDGIEGARKDYQNHRPPNVENRDEYRHPNNVPRDLRHDYRDAFRRGYQVGVDHIMNGGGPR